MYTCRVPQESFPVYYFFDCMYTCHFEIFNIWDSPLAGEECGTDEAMQNKGKKGVIEGRMQAKGAVNGKMRRVEDRPGDLGTSTSTA